MSDEMEAEEEQSGAALSTAEDITVIEKLDTDIDEDGYACCVVRASDGYIYRIRNKGNGNLWDIGDLLNEAIDKAEEVSE